MHRDYARLMQSPHSPHVSDHLWEAIAMGELPPAERDAIAAHVVACAECSAIYRSLRALEEEAPAIDPGAPAAAPSAMASRAWYAAAAAALIAIAGALLLWNLALRRENTELAAVVARSTAAPATTAGDRVLPIEIGAEVNVPIVDVQAGALRGAGTQPVEATLAADVPLATLILNTDIRDAGGTYRLMVIDAAGQTVWQSDGLRLTEFHTFTIALSPRDLGPGVFRLEISRPGGEQRLHSYTLRILDRP